MKKLISILIILITLNACIQEVPKNNIKSSPIPPKEFQTIIKKTWLMNAHVFNNKKQTLLPKDSVSNLTLTILNDIGYQEEDLTLAIKYYSSKPVLLDSLIKDIRDSLEENFLNISHDMVEDTRTIRKDTFFKIIGQYPKFNSLEIDENFNFTQKAKDSIIEFFRKNPEKLNNYDLNSFIDKINSSGN